MDIYSWISLHVEKGLSCRNVTFPFQTSTISFSIRQHYIMDILTLNYNMSKLTLPGLNCISLFFPQMPLKVSLLPRQSRATLLFLWWTWSLLWMFFTITTPCRALEVPCQSACSLRHHTPCLLRSPCIFTLPYHCFRYPLLVLRASRRLPHPLHPCTKAARQQQLSLMATRHRYCILWM